MSFKSLLNKTCDIELLNFGSQLNTGERIENWEALFSDLSCRIRTRSLSEKRFSSPEYQHATHSLYLEYIRLPKGRLRVKSGGNYYEVTGNIELGGAEKYLCLYLDRKTACA